MIPPRAASFGIVAITVMFFMFWFLSRNHRHHDHHHVRMLFVHPPLPCFFSLHPCRFSCIFSLHPRDFSFLGSLSSPRFVRAPFLVAFFQTKFTLSQRQFSLPPIVFAACAVDKNLFGCALQRSLPFPPRLSRGNHRRNPPW